MKGLNSGLGYAVIESEGFAESDVVSFHYQNGSVRLIFNFMEDMIQKIVFGNDSKNIDYLFDRREFLFLSVFDFSRQNVYRRVAESANSFEKKESKVSLSLENITVKKIDDLFYVRIIFESPYGDCSFGCSEILYGQKYL